MKSIHSFRKQRLFFLAFVLTALLAILLAATGKSLRFTGDSSLAASPAGGTVSPSNPTVSYTGGPFIGINETNTADNATITCTPATPCDCHRRQLQNPRSSL